MPPAVSSLPAQEPPEARLARMQASYQQQLQRASRSGLGDLGVGRSSRVVTFGDGDTFGSQVEDLDNSLTPRPSPPKPVRLPVTMTFPLDSGGTTRRAPQTLSKQTPGFYSQQENGVIIDSFPLEAVDISETGNQFTPASLATMTHEEKDRAIVAFQREVNSLKSRLTKVLDTTESTMSDLAQAQEQAFEEQTQREQELLAEIIKWKENHPEVIRLQEDNHFLHKELDEHKKNVKFMVNKKSCSQVFLKYGPDLCPFIYFRQ